ncbi:MAG TPA: LuxR C-terminal-related transcriptional regulator [Verrucomicrobiae bacterium]|nr:LuxR C-terminal-related transcriptional regulator [Verrucomicrobiae bacterium]
MARGLDNIQIGAELFGGEATVRTHVGHDLSKLEASSRVQPGGRPRVRSCAAKVCLRAAQQWGW